jgi:hypothetical protein
MFGAAVCCRQVSSAQIREWLEEKKELSVLKDSPIFG